MNSLAMKGRAKQGPGKIWHWMTMIVLAALSIVLFLWSRALFPSMNAAPRAEWVIGGYVSLGVLAVLALPGFRSGLAIWSAITWMAMIGLLISLRHHAVPMALVALVGGAAITAVAWHLAVLRRALVSASGPFYRRLYSVICDAIPPSVRAVAAKELRMWLVILYPAALTKTLPAERFYRRYSTAELGLLWGGSGVAAIVTAAAYLLLEPHFPLWSLAIPAAFSLAMVYGLAIAKSIPLLPSTVEDRTLTIRNGLLSSIDISFDQIGDIALVCSAQKGVGCVNLSFLAKPNLVLRLKAPITITSPIAGSRDIDVLCFHIEKPMALIDFINKMRLLNKDGRD